MNQAKFGAIMIEANKTKTRDWNLFLIQGLELRRSIASAV